MARQDKKVNLMPQYIRVRFVPFILFLPEHFNHLLSEGHKKLHLVEIVDIFL